MTLARGLRRVLLAACLCCAAWTFGPTASAQAQGFGTAPTLSPRDIEELVRSTDRERLHRDVAVELVGREQGDNDLRSGTSALAKSDRATAPVDIDELYQRRLAMYDEGATFQDAGQAAARTKSLATRRATRPPAADWCTAHTNRC